MMGLEILAVMIICAVIAVFLIAWAIWDIDDE